MAWAAFLACSWTWCIGMFLPVLLVRDFGVAGWIVFAIPNVLGAAAMPWVLGRARTASKLAGYTGTDPPPLVVRHETAMRIFSLVTIAFHLFFMFWVIAWLTPMGAVITIALAGGFFLLRR